MTTYEILSVYADDSDGPTFPTFEAAQIELLRRLVTHAAGDDGTDRINIDEAAGMVARWSVNDRQIGPNDSQRQWAVHLGDSNGADYLIRPAWQPTWCRINGSVEAIFDRGTVTRLMFTPDTPVDDDAAFDGEVTDAGPNEVANMANCHDALRTFLSTNGPTIEWTE